MSTRSASIHLPVVDSDRPDPSDSGGEPLLQRLLREQNDLSAVERFSQFHEQCDAPAQERFYRDLIPATPPGPGQQYAFEVDLDKCSGCKACVTACHSLNGLDEGETWRSVGLLHGGVAGSPVQKTVTTACHHCLEPACLEGCPVKAYDKDPDTGIVKHLDDQCIGCQYCVFTCPYEVPQYNKSLGIVRKCDMCSDRLAEGEAPACVQACPSQAITIGLVDEGAAIDAAQADAFLPGAPEPALTVPTTTYKSTSALPHNMLPADFYRVRPAEQHMPLVWMLVLTQLSVGTLMAVQLLRFAGVEDMLEIGVAAQAIAILVLGVIALGASTMHLGRPQYAWRAFLGLRTSWLSREILAFGAFAGLAALHAAVTWVASTDPDNAPALTAMAERWDEPLGLVTVLVGALAVFCSAMIYHATGRRWWSIGRTAFKFGMTCVVLGLAATVMIHWAVGVATHEGVSEPLVRMTRICGLALIAAVAIKLFGESLVFLSLRNKTQGDLKRSALLLKGELAQRSFFRYALGVVAGLILPLFFIVTADDRFPIATLVGAVLALVGLLAGELLERMSFFSAMSSPRMPGGMP
ncbi:MAG: DmsC/YnfH family molybdoenzyme membrane anchor subunit [Myxococcota bacterium]